MTQTCGAEFDESDQQKYIENLEQIGLLRTLGFQYAQGFAFSHPVSATEAARLLVSAGEQGG